MDHISFRSFKLFKNIGLVHHKKDKPPSPERTEKASFWRKLFSKPGFFLVIFTLVIAYFVSYPPYRSLPDLREGEVAPSDVTAPLDLAIEDTETTEKRKNEAASVVLPVYSFDLNVFLNTKEKINQFFNLGREWLSRPSSSQKIEDLQKGILEKFGLETSARDLESLRRANFSRNFEETLISIIEKISLQGIILSKNLFSQNEEVRGFYLQKGLESERPTKVNEILEVREAKERLNMEIERLSLSLRDKSCLLNLAAALLLPNITFNRMETEARRERARGRVETVFYNIKKGKVIIRKGDEATAEAIQQITVINENLRSQSSWVTNMLGTFLLFLIILLTLWYYLKSVIRLRAPLREYIMVGTALILSLLFYKLSLFLAGLVSENTKFFLLSQKESYWYGLPYQMGVLTFAFLTSIPIAIIYAVINSLLVGYILDANFFLMVFCFVGSLAAIYGIKYYQTQKRSSILRAGLFLIAPVNVFCIITFELIKEKWGPLEIFSSEIFMGLIGGIVSASLGFLFLPIFESVFKFTTQPKLLDLTNSDLPIFRQMAVQAPGTYHHSLLVASLAENAAKELRLDSMLVKAGALYHDIGKTKMPEYFIENRSKNVDAHKDLSPSMSTLVIVNHVKEGAELAKKLKLPQKVREIIEQHHGSSLVRYFYQKAKEKYDPEMHKIGEESYRYPGPAPESKEAALILLADSVEAASRSLRAPAETSLRRVITEIFESYIKDGQLDDSGFSLKELRMVASSFLATLLTIYHPRVDYPGFDFELKKKKNSSAEKNNAHDRNHQHTE